MEKATRFSCGARGIEGNWMNRGASIRGDWIRAVRSISRAASALFRSRLKEPPSPPVPPVDLLLHRERKKRSFCNQDTVHRTCERSRIGQCSWHAPPWLRFTPFDREIEPAIPNFQVFQPREIIQWIRNFCSFATSEVDSRTNLVLRESVEKPTVKDWERIAVRKF